MAAQLKRVLLVDDDHGLLRLLSMRLQSAGYDVACATSGEEAMSRLPVFRPGVMITDLRMGGMDGMTLFKAVHKQAPTLPVIMLTAHGTIPDAVSATAKGVFSFLTKPFDAKELLQRLDDAFKAGGGAAPANEDDIDVWRSEIITRSAIMEEVLNQARLIAENDVSVFIHGQSGSGKELLARAIHQASPRRNKPFVALNCSAIPEHLLESELFGHKKGAFTGATSDYQGLFQAANGGTLFLDEIGDMPMAFQAKLLRALQERAVRPVGSTVNIDVDVRIISATHRDLDEAVEEKEFREDLYFRLNVVSLDLPSLSQRREDIPLLAKYFLEKLCRGAERHRNKKFSNEALEMLVAAPWPGNVRQLYNVVEQVVVLSTTPLIPASLVQRALRSQPKEMLSFAEARNQFEREYLAQVLKMTNGNVTQAARIAGRNRTEFYKLLNKHQIIPSIFKSQG